MKELVKRLANEFMDKEYAHEYMNSHQSTRIATQIRVLREQRGLTQKQLADLSNMKQERISALEDVNYDAWTISTLRKLARAFDTTLQISFVPFSQGILDIRDFDYDHLQVESREMDLKHFVAEHDTEQIIGGKICESFFQNLVDKLKIGIETDHSELIIYGSDLPIAVNDNNYQDAA